MLSIEEINKLELENEAYKQSEQEAQEIIAELKAENEELQAKVQRLTYNNHKLDEFFDKVYKENAELKALSEELGKIIECKNGTIATLAKTRDELKAQKDKYYQQTLDDEIQINELYQEIERLKAGCDIYKTFYRAKHSDIKGLLFKYKQALQEIKKVAEETIIVYTDIVQSKKLKALDLRNRMQQILQKINEVE